MTIITTQPPDMAATIIKTPAMIPGLWAPIISNIVAPQAQATLTLRATVINQRSGIGPLLPQFNLKLPLTAALLL